MNPSPPASSRGLTLYDPPSEADQIALERRREREALARRGRDAALAAADAKRARKAARLRATLGLVGVLLLALLALLAGCGSRALSHHVTAARAAKIAIDGARELLDTACAHERSRAMALEGMTPEEHAQHVARCERARGRHAEARAAWTAYVAASLEAAVLEAGADPLAWGVAFARAYGHVAGALRELGVRAPTLPGGIVELLGDGGALENP